MYKVYFYNFGYYSQNTGNTLEEAKEIARKAGFQSTIYDPNDELVMSYCVINGFKKYYSMCSTNNSLDYLRPIE